MLVLDVLTIVVLLCTVVLVVLTVVVMVVLEYPVCSNTSGAM
jgi:hypothetical protein